LVNVKLTGVAEWPVLKWLAAYFGQYRAALAHLGPQWPDFDFLAGLWC
jgi:hypothetical protein